MTLHAAAQVFDFRTASETIPGDVTEIRCCDEVLTERAAAIACDRCHTVIERGDQPGEWRVIREKGRPHFDA